ncbi:Disease resistance-responsive family protein, putative [Theobroma cacao]|uniref:Dirigent protein n=1 Tax=Theobroma cacao TaxID=3641 RepID=A0A061FUB1_THECC|nr:Disease resistance-responsive family protein, putative [Theobroma cacao]
MGYYQTPSMILLVFFLLTMVNRSTSARTLGKPTSSHHHHRKHHRISFLMQDVLNVTQPATAKVTSQLPFSKPLGFFPPNAGIPIPETNPPVPGTGLSTQTLDISDIGLYFPARATLQELEFGAVMTIDENLLDGTVNGSPVGKAQGVYVASSEGGPSHMMALTTFFANSKFKDGLRFFGLHRRDVAESHIAVIGGIGKYVGANGYATVKAVDLRSNAAAEKQGVNKLLSFNVYLI